MSEYEREAFKALRDAQDRILEIMYGTTNVTRFKRLHKWAAQTDTLSRTRTALHRTQAHRRLAF